MALSAYIDDETDIACFGLRALGLFARARAADPLLKHLRKKSRAGLEPLIVCGMPTRAIRPYGSRTVGEPWSIRIGSGYRALALLQDDTFFWFWIGTHDEYEQFLS